MTAEELLRLPSGQWRYELVQGELRRMSPSGHVHGKVAMRIGSRLAVFVDEHRLGETYGAETGFILSRDPTRCAPRTRRLPRPSGSRRWSFRQLVTFQALRTWLWK